MLSFWETESFLNYDTIIIGSGIVGLSAAISLKEAAPNQSVLVLERSLLPTGASTRNAGFACFGSLTEVLYDLNLNGPDITRTVIEKRLRGLSRLRERLPDAAMDYQHVGGYELIFEKELPALQEIEIANDLLRDLFPKGVYSDRPDLVETFRFDRENVRTMVYNPHEGHLHSGKMMRALLQLAQSNGVEIRTGAEVTDIDDSGNGVTITVKDPVRGDLEFRAEKAAVCTNAFSTKLCPDSCITPGRGQVLITKPIPTLPWEGACHFDEGFYYFRNIGKRVLFGGGRNLDFATETTTTISLNEQIQNELERLLRDLILPGQKFEIEQRWSGIMGFSEDKQPVIRKISPQLVLGFACNGMGVSLAATIGDEIADLLL
jgi:gamma-glutamylputrescine oxidase